MRSQRGSALFLILIAVALFGALSYAITQSGRGGGDISKEQVDLEASKIVQWAGLVQAAVNRMILLQGVDPLMLDYRSPSWVFGNGSYNCWNQNHTCTTTDCRIFDPLGGGVEAQVFTASGFEPASYVPGLPAPGTTQVKQGSIFGVGSSAPELLSVTFFLQPDICNRINKQLGINTNFTATSPAIEDVATSRPDNFNGCMANNDFTSTKVLGDQDARFAGKMMFCAPFDHYAGGLYFVNVVIPR